MKALSKRLMSDGTGPSRPVLRRVGFFLVVGAILFVLFDRFGPYQPGGATVPGRSRRSARPARCSTGPSTATSI